MQDLSMADKKLVYNKIGSLARFCGIWDIHNLAEELFHTCIRLLFTHFGDRVWNLIWHISYEPLLLLWFFFWPNFTNVLLSLPFFSMYSFSNCSFVDNFHVRYRFYCLFAFLAVLVAYIASDYSQVHSFCQDVTGFQYTCFGCDRSWENSSRHSADELTVVVRWRKR